MRSPAKRAAGAAVPTLVLILLAARIAMLVPLIFAVIYSSRRGSFGDQRMDRKVAQPVVHLPGMHCGAPLRRCRDHSVHMRYKQTVWHSSPCYIIEHFIVWHHQKKGSREEEG